jgi:HK97 family phage major capsid protein
VTFGKVTLRATILAALCTLSISLAADASNIDALIKASLSAAIGSEMDRAGLFGSGVAEPLGLYATPEINTYSLGANGKVLSDYDWASFASQYVANANGRATAVVMSPRSSFALDRLKDTLLQPLTPPASFKALTPFVSNQVGNALTWGSAAAASAMFVGDFTGLAFGIAPSEGGQYGIRLDVAREAAFNTLQVQIRAYLRCDVAVLRPTWFTRVCGVL